MFDKGGLFEPFKRDRPALGLVAIGLAIMSLGMLFRDKIGEILLTIAAAFMSLGGVLIYRRFLRSKTFAIASIVCFAAAIISSLLTTVLNLGLLGGIVSIVFAALALFVLAVGR